MNGTRLPDESDWSSKHPHGSYWKRNGSWFCITPRGDFGDLSKHRVLEHDDGTITVNPSILITHHPHKGPPQQGWHGFLEGGVWRSC